MSSPHVKITPPETSTIQAGPTPPCEVINNRPWARLLIPLGVIVVIGTALDLYNIDSLPFWFDEALSEAIAMSRGVSFVKLAFGREAGMGFYYIVLHVWLMVVHPTDFNIRVLSATCALAALPVVYFLGTKLFDQRVGLAAALLLAVNPAFVKYAHEARSYALAVLLTLISWSSLVDLVRQHTRLDRAKYIVSTTLAIYSHYLAALILPAQALAVWFFLGKRFKLRAWIDIGIICALTVPLVIPMGYWYPGGEDWIAEKFGRPGLAALKQVAVIFAGGIPPPRIRQRSLELLVTLGFASYLATWTSVFKAYLYDNSSYVCVALAFSIPIGLLMSISQLKPLFIDRYLLICLPFYLLIVAVGWCAVPSRLVTLVGITLFAVLSVWSDVAAYNSYAGRHDWHRAIAYVTERARNHDKFIFIPGATRLEFEHNKRQFSEQDKALMILYPNWDSVFEVSGKYLGSDDPVDSALNLPQSRLWIIVDSDQTNVSLEQLLTRLNTKYSKIQYADFRHLTIIFCEPH